MDEARPEQTAGWITYRAWSADDIIIGGLTVGTLYRDTEEAGDASLHWREPIRASAAWRSVVQRERGEAFDPDDLEGGVFEVQLPTRQRVGQVPRLMGGRPARDDAPVAPEELPDRGRRTRQRQPRGPQFSVAVQEVQDGLGAGDALQVRGRVVAELENAVNHGARHGRRRPLARGSGCAAPPHRPPAPG